MLGRMFKKLVIAMACLIAALWIAGYRPGNIKQALANWSSGNAETVTGANAGSAWGR